MSPVSGPPATAVTVAGAGFAADEVVDIYYGTADQALTVASGTGNFAGIAIQVPASAVPGTAYLTAAGRRLGLGAQAQFTVSAAAWAQYRYSATHEGVNPYESVLSASNVSGLDVAWSFATGGEIDSPPTVAGWSTSARKTATCTPSMPPPGPRPGSFVHSSPAVAGGMVYVGAGDGSVYALEASTGPRPGASPQAARCSLRRRWRAGGVRRLGRRQGVFVRPPGWSRAIVSPAAG